MMILSNGGHCSRVNHAGALFLLVRERLLFLMLAPFQNRGQDRKENDDGNNEVKITLDAGNRAAEAVAKQGCAEHPQDTDIHRSRM